LVKKRNIWVYLLCSVICICIILFIISNSSTQKKELTRIEKVIKNHNRVKESISNPKYPILSPPSNSQSTIIYGDSVRVSKQEIDSVDDYMRYWYEVLDTNSNGEIDDTETK
jgi:hypothetical protein